MSEASYLEEAKKVITFRGDTYSSYEVVGLIGKLVAEIERLRAEHEITRKKAVRLEIERNELLALVKRLHAGRSR